MTSQVTVVDPLARRHMVKVSPSTSLSDVLYEACTKFRLDASQYGFKNANKAVDLSRPFRLSGLTSGAKLELVQISKSPAVVSVALDLPDSEVASGSPSRLIDKFPSNTTLWLVLRKFEEGVAGSVGSGPRNFTSRGLPQTTTGSSGAGRLYFERPVLQAMGRDFASFTELQKSLSQIGINSGSVRLRLSFELTQTPLEEALLQMQEYFETGNGPREPQAAPESAAAAAQPIPPDTASSQAPTEPSDSVPPDGEQQPLEAASASPQVAELSTTMTQSAEAQTEPVQPETSASSADTEADPPKPVPSSPPTATAANEQSITTIDPSTDHPTVPTDQEPMSDASSRPTTVFAPPSSSTPLAAQTAHNAADYVPTVDHARQHQARLAAAGVNRRLASDAEQAVAQQAQASRLAAVAEVEIKARFPDQSTAVARFGRADTAAGLHAWVRGLLARQAEPFALHRAAARGGGTEALPQGEERLIGDLGLVGKVLVTVVWGEGASLEARSGSALRPEVTREAQAIRVQEPALVDVKEALPPEAGRGDGKKGKGEGKGLPKWLKMPGKK